MMNSVIDAAALSLFLKDNPQTILLDASYALPDTGGLNPKMKFERERIGNARFFDVESIADRSSHLPHMLPSEAVFQKEVRNLGIDPETPVIIYGQGSTAMGPARAWWMFKIFGHQAVHVLDGGLPAWKAAGLEVSTTPPAPTPPARGRFVARLKPALLAIRQDVAEASESGSARIIDARPKARFLGQSPEPRPGLKSGHIPASLNLPAQELFDPATGKLFPAKILKERFQTLGIGESTPVIATCGSGITACTIALALDYIGYTPASVYDGSWAEWGKIE